MSELHSELQAIRDQYGKLTPKLVVAAARDETNPLHYRFEWDDSVAGERWREEQAHDLIKSVRIVYKRATPDSPEQTIRAYHAVRTDRGFVYEPAAEVAADPVLAQMVLLDMAREWRALKARYGHFQEFLEMVRSDVAV